MHLPGITRHPTGRWATQLARNLAGELAAAGCRFTYLIRDRDAKFTDASEVASSRTVPQIRATVGSRTLQAVAKIPARPLSWDPSYPDEVDLMPRDSLPIARAATMGRPSVSYTHLTLPTN